MARKMGPRFEATPVGELPETVVIPTKLQQEGTRLYFLRDIVQQVAMMQGVLAEGERINWDPFRPEPWGTHVFGALPDGRRITAWFEQQREYLYTEPVEGKPGKWGYTLWHNLVSRPKLPEVLRGKELIEYRLTILVEEAEELPA